MSDFVKSIQVSFQQLDFTKQHGLVNGLTNVIIENMNKLGLYQRPIHCKKRESVYIKEDIFQPEKCVFPLFRPLR